MSKPAKAAEAARPENLSFEAALERLESVVATMESGELPLEQLLARYEEGIQLARACQQKLTDAELKLQQLEKTAAGTLALKPLVVEEGESLKD